MNYSGLKTTIDANIRQNGLQEITGPVLNGVLNDMVSYLGMGYQFLGFVTPEMEGGTPDIRCFVFATQAGTYEGYGNLVVSAGEDAVFYFDTAWHKGTLAGGGVSRVYRSSDLTEDLDHFNDTANDTFNAYTINSLHNRILALEANAEILGSLQAQIDSVAARDSWDELTASALFADAAAVSSLYADAAAVTSLAAKTIALNGNDLATTLSGFITAEAVAATYATKEALAAVSNRVGVLEARTNWDEVFGIDANGNVYVKKRTVEGQEVARGFYNYGFVNAGGENSGGGGGGGGNLDLPRLWASLQNTDTVTTYNNYKIAIAHLPTPATGLAYTASGTGQTLETRIKIADGYKLPTTSEWSGKQDTISDLSTIRTRSNEGHDAYEGLATISLALQSLQSQIDSVATRDCYDELTVSSLAVDVAAVSALYTNYMVFAGESLADILNALLSKEEAAETYATITALGGVSDRVGVLEARTNWDDYLGVDASGNIYVKMRSDNTARGFYNYGFVNAGGENSGGGGGGGGNVDLPRVWKSLQNNDSVTTYNNYKIATAHLPTLGSGLAYSSSGTGESLETNLGIASGYKLPTATEWAGKQDTISDLSTIRSYAGEGHTAYGWGNHADAGYLTSADLSALELCLQSLQSQIDSVAARDAWDELQAAAFYADMAAVGALYAEDITLGGNSLKSIPNSYLANSTVKFNGVTVSLGGSGTIGIAGIIGSSSVGSSSVPIYYTGSGFSAVTASSMFSDLSSDDTTNLSITIAGKTRNITSLYAKYDSAGENISTEFGVVSKALQSLQSQIDSVASRDVFDELRADNVIGTDAYFATVHGTLDGNADSASVAARLVGSSYGIGNSSTPVYFSGGLPVACQYAFGNSSGNAALNNGTINTNLYAEKAQKDSDGYNIASNMTVIGTALKSLQSQIDSVAARLGSEDELKAGVGYFDMLSVGAGIYAGSVQAIGYVIAGGSASSSDARLKKGIKEISADEAIWYLKQLKGREWIWNEQKPDLAGKRGSGLVAQEVERTMPWMVLDQGGELSLTYDSLWGVAVPVLQSHERRIAELEKENRELKKLLYK